VIIGTTTADYEAVIYLTVRGPSGDEEHLTAVIDTGFNGWFSLPPELIASLALPWRRRGRAVLADGSETVFDIYEGVVIWDGKPRRVVVDEASTAPLVGMSLLNGYALSVEVRAGGRVTITVLPSPTTPQPVQ